MDDDEQAATLRDLVARIELAAADAERSARETGTSVDAAAVARTVADDLPPNWPPTAAGVDRQDIIDRIAALVVNGRWAAEAEGLSLYEAACRVVEAWDAAGHHDNTNAVGDAMEQLRSAVEEGADE